MAQGHHGSPQRGRRLVPDQREVVEPHARGRDDDLRGPSSELRRPPRARPVAPAPRAPLPAEARLPAGADGASLLGRRPDLQPRVPRAPLGAAVAGLRGPAPQDGRAGVLPAAGPLEAALGAVAGPGPDAEALRARHQDPPRPGRRGVGRRHRDRPVRREAGPGAERGRPRLGPRARAVVGHPAGQGRRGPGAAPLGRRAALERAIAAPANAVDRSAEAVEAVGEVGLELRQPGAQGAAQRRDRLSPPLRLGARDLGQFKRIKDALGGTVNDVVLAVVGGRCATGSTPAASGSRAWSCGRRCRSSSGPRTSRASSATGSR